MLDVNGWEDILCGVDIGTEWNLNGVPRIRPFGFVEIAKKVEC